MRKVSDDLQNKESFIKNRTKNMQQKRRVIYGKEEKVRKQRILTVNLTSFLYYLLFTYFLLAHDKRRLEKVSKKRGKRV